MSKGTINAGVATGEAIAADEHLKTVILDHVSGGDVWCAFGEPAVVGEGFRLGATRPALVLSGRLYEMQGALNVICASGDGVVAYHTFKGPSYGG